MEDRVLSKDIEKIRQIVRENTIVSDIEKALRTGR
jgi:hypothetical protein